MRPTIEGNTTRRGRFRNCLWLQQALAAGLALVSLAAAGATFNVAILDDEFDPKFLTIAPGDTVVWTNVGGSAHTVIADNGDFDSTVSGQSSIPAGETFIHTFPNLGLNPYFCQLHGGPGGQDMSGVIRVADPNSNTPPQTPVNVSPNAGATNRSTSPTLTSTPFVDNDIGDIHLASQWILRKVQLDTEVLDTGTDDSNKTALALTGLENATVYGWKVRYLDDRGAWSDYSQETQFTTIAAQQAEGTGLTASYGKYNRKKDEASVIVTKVDLEIDFDWRAGKPTRGVPANSFYVRWEGSILPEFSERYRFRVRADGGIRLWINGSILIDDWVDGPFAIYRNNTSVLQAGVPVNVRLEYFDATGKASVNLRWSSPSQPTEVIPQARLFPLAP